MGLQTIPPSSTIECVDVFPFALLILFEWVCVLVALRFGRYRGTLKQRASLLSMVVIGVVSMIFLSVRMITPHDLWLGMVENNTVNNTPYAARHRPFSLLFWPFSHLGFYVPLIAAKLISDDLYHPKSVSLTALRFALIYWVPHFFVMGYILN